MPIPKAISVDRVKSFGFNYECHAVALVSFLGAADEANNMSTVSDTNKKSE
jgi:hypothetical protein